MIDEAIDRLIAVFAQAGLPPITAPGPEIETVLTEISAAIAPMTLPAQLVTFWRRVDICTVSMGPFPDLSTLAFALASWRAHNDEPGLPVPRVMFPLCYASHSFLFVELDTEATAGGAVFYWGYGGTPWLLRHLDLAAYLDQLTTMVELGEWRQEALEDGSPWYCFDPDDLWDDIAAVRLPASVSVGRYGRQRELDEDVRHWPAHWLAANGYGAEDRTARGATTTIAALLAEAAHGRDASGTVHARVARLAGQTDGAQIVVEDGTASVEIWCSGSLSPYGPVCGRSFEFDVVVFAGPVERPDISGLHCEVTRHAANGDLESAQAAAKELYLAAFNSASAGVATGLRPLD